MVKSENTPKRLYFSEIDSPLGGIILAEYEGKICMAEFSGGKRSRKALTELSTIYRTDIASGETSLMKKAKKQLDLYFSHKLRIFHLPLDYPGTAFQKSIWRQLLKIPFGKTVNYGWIAGKAGSPRASRAAGAAIGSNKISIIVPCHRVIGKDGSLTGFGGGLRRKEWLLRHEGAI